jgi:hypothetical protein
LFIVVQPPQLRSAITNGTRVVAPGIDGRSAQARRFRDLVRGMEQDLGGAAVLSEGQRQLVRRAATISAQLEAIEARAATGEQIDVSSYATASNALRRLLTSLGLRRVAKAAPRLADMLEQRGGAAA